VLFTQPASTDAEAWVGGSPDDLSLPADQLLKKSVKGNRALQRPTGSGGPKSKPGCVYAKEFSSYASCEKRME
jgi:hypothetical protein